MSKASRLVSRRLTRPVRVGRVVIGLGAPVSIQSMTKTATHDVVSTVAEIRRLERAGCEIIRVAVKEGRDAEAIRKIKERIHIPLVADIHFDHRLAIASIESGADKIRVNPGNMKREEMGSIIELAKKRKVAIRIGVNSGSVAGVAAKFQASSLKPQEKSAGGQSHELLVKTALSYLRLFEKDNFRNIVISLKASSVRETVRAYRALAGKCDYPFHIGVTASGLVPEATVKSAIGIGALLLDGIGDTIRVSLTGPSSEEVAVGRRILAAVDARHFGPEIISCPTCGRCQVDLVRIAKEVERTAEAFNARRRSMRPVKIAVMGCEVNGPGEAREADIGIAAGKGCGMLFRNGALIRRVAEKDFSRELMKELKAIDKSRRG